MAKPQIDLKTEKEAAEILRIPARTLARIRKSPETKPPVPFINLGSNVFYDSFELTKWAKTQRVMVRRGRPPKKK